MMSHLNFLICSERSGSNFIASLLNGHPDISAPPPSHLFRLFALNAHRYEPLTDEENWQFFKADVIEAFEAMPGEWTSGFPQDALNLNLEERSIPEVLARIYAAERRVDKAQMSFVKENYTYQFLTYLTQSWPEAKFIYQVRDPRDMALSLFKTGNMPGGIIEATDQWLLDQTTTLDAIKTLPLNTVLQVRYEDLLSDAAATCSKICDHLGVPMDPAIFSFHTAPRTIANAKLMGAWNNLDKGILKNNHSKFLSELTRSEIEYIELRCAPLMKQFGYELSQGDSALLGKDRDEQIQILSKAVRQPPAAVPESALDQDMRSRRKHLITRVISR